MPDCKEKELIELVCSDCRMNYCLKHRHASDHSCSKKYATDSSSARQTQASSTAAAAAMQRFMNNGLSKTTNFVQKLGNTVNKAITPNNTPSTTPTNSGGRNTVNVQTVQGSLTEDEALALAVQQSLNHPPSGQPPATSSLASNRQQGSRDSPIVLGEDEDADLARAIELSKREYEKNRDKCALS